jgi:hypothetical protein
MSVVPSPSHRQSGHPIDPQRKAIKRVLRRALDEFDVPQKALAAECGVDTSLVCRWLSDLEPDLPSVLHLPAITREVGPGFLEWINLRCHFETMPPPHEPAGLPALTGSLAAQGGKAVQQLIQALADGNLSTDERAALQPDLYRLRATLNGILDHVGLRAGDLQ